jgi:lipopolysaccharide/colanic/teichoic acid biosynthesis glycosyltransferase
LLSVRPGITSVASIRYRHEESLLTGPDWEAKYTNVILPKKLRLELEYLERRTLASDVGVLLRTVLTLLH